MTAPETKSVGLIPPHIVAAICTYERPAGLRQTLAALDQQICRPFDASCVSIIVIDNSTNATAQATVLDFASTAQFKIHYRQEPRKGLTFARNAALDVGRELAATHFAFIDDDEMPEPQWLSALFQSMTATGAGAVIGPVWPIFEIAPGRQIPCASYATSTAVTDGFTNEGYTCNVMVDMAVLAETGIAFEADFNELGGEDTMFFRALVTAGHRIAWADRAIVHERVPRLRMSPQWLWKRWYRTGAIEARLGVHGAETTKGRAANLGKGLIRVAAGSGRVAASAVVSGWRQPGRTVASFYTLCRGAGLIANVMGRDYKEYARQNYR